MRWRKIPRDRNTKESLRARCIPSAGIILPEIHVDMELFRIRILDTGSQLREQALLRMKDISYPCSERIRKFPLLKDVQVGPQLQEIGSVPAFYPAQRRLTIIDPQAEYVPLPADLKGKIGFFRKSSRIIG